jgi:hypothetical protein
MLTDNFEINVDGGKCSAQGNEVIPLLWEMLGVSYSSFVTTSYTWRREYMDVAAPHHFRSKAG